MDIYSPEDAIVTRLFKFGGNVLKGESLVQLFSTTLEQKIERISTIGDVIDIAMRPFTDGRNMQEKESAKRILKDLTLLNSFDAEAVTVIKGRVGLGDGDWPQVDALYNTFTNNKNTIEQQNLAANEFDNKKKDMLDSLTKLSDAVKLELKLLGDFKSNLLIKAPIDGVFHAECLETFFYKKGALLGTFFFKSK